MQSSDEEEFTKNQVWFWARRLVEGVRALRPSVAGKEWLGISAQARGSSWGHASGAYSLEGGEQRPSPAPRHGLWASDMQLSRGRTLSSQILTWGGGLPSYRAG